VGFLDGLLGTKGKLKGAAPDRLFAMTTANVTLETGLGLKSKQCAGVVFQPIATADFKQIVTETEELLKGTAEETGTEVRSHDDQYGYRWLILRDDDPDDLVVAMNTVSVELQGAGYGDRLLAAVFAYADEGGRTVYFIYNFKRGAYYPFVPAPGTQARDTEHELRIKAQLARELPWEEDLARWFPLWDIPL
jgi:GNAT superfamily N-acetyltransferase